MSAKLSDIEIEAIRYRYERGEHVLDLADCFEVSDTTIKKHCKDLLPAPTARKVDPEAARAMRESGLTYTAIAKEFGCRPGTVSEVLARQSTPSQP